MIKRLAAVALVLVLGLVAVMAWLLNALAELDAAIERERGW